MRILLTAITACALAAGITACSSTPERTQHKLPRFAELDSNGDGKLNRTEFNQLPSRRITPDEIFDRADRDGDGYVDRNEFINIREHLKRRMEERRG